ncbi:hypothetical protein GGR02_002292 [Anoxybacillus voinovskiensis]|uniref:Uncharacterized protein n=1 Tax=Anoxybacteroides voinovskiense TaxID=230470 RepID=A0A840DSE0_9BACL|nr:hypothetical protein [Anoxybacillus voinovskiensis]
MIFARWRSCSREEAGKLVFSQMILCFLVKQWIINTRDIIIKFYIQLSGIAYKNMLEKGS